MSRTDQDVDRYRRHIAAEWDAAALYRGLAALSQGRRREVFEELAGIEDEAAPERMPRAAPVSEAATRAASVPEGATALPLTRRETEVLGLLAQGLNNREIAGVMWLSDRTVERHITSLYRKIGVARRSEATAFALRHGLG